MPFDRHFDSVTMPGGSGCLLTGLAVCEACDRELLRPSKRLIDDAVPSVMVLDIPSSDVA